MKNNFLDKIYIRDLALRCIIGTNPDERKNKQDVIINIILYADLKKACLTDNLNDTVDYKLIKKNIIEMVENSSFNLLERLAENIADLCLQNQMVNKVKITLDKPGALRFAKSAAIKIKRCRR